MTNQLLPTTMIKKMYSNIKTNKIQIYIIYDMVQLAKSGSDLRTEIKVCTAKS